MPEQDVTVPGAGPEVFTPDENPELSIATQFIPWPHDDHRTKYLGCICCGFSVREALNFIDRSKTWLSEQRKDPSFVKAEEHIPDIRKTLSREYIELDTVRNYRLVLLKDFEIIKKSLDKEEKLTSQEHDYLIKLRSMYNPQQLAILDALTGTHGSDGWDFAKWITQNQQVIQMSRTSDTITMRKI